jgi:hypothetical protein
MTRIFSLSSLIASLSGLVLGSSQMIGVASINMARNTAKPCSYTSPKTDFLVIAGEDNPENKEIPLEKMFSIFSVL